MNMNPMLSKQGKIRSGFEARKATENIKYVTQIFKEGGGGVSKNVLFLLR
jgi:hypothetical protein